MKMKHPIMIVAAMTIGFAAQAQSVDEGIKMYKYERYQSAKTALAPAAAASATANYYLGLSELGLGNTAGAKAIFSKFPEDVANIAGLARVAFVEKNAAEGMKIAQTVASKAGKKAWEPLKLAADAVNYFTNDYTERTTEANYLTAIGWYEESLKRNDNLDTRIALADAYRKVQGGGGKAMNNYETVTGKDPKNSLAFSRIGSLWYDAKNYPLALESYGKAKDADPANPIPYRDLANAYFWVGKYDLAQQNIEKYLELSDKSDEDQIQYLNILYLNKKYEDAARKAQELINKGVVKPGFYGMLAFSQLEMKDTANALINARKFFALQDPNKLVSDNYFKYGIIMLGSNMEDSADYYFNKAVSMDTGSKRTETYRKIGEAFKSKKGASAYAKAGEWYGKIVAENPNTQILDYYYWGFWSYYGGKVDVATQAFEKMYAKDSTQPSAVFWLGRTKAAADEEAKTGIAVPYFKKWETMDGKKENALLMQAYQYLALYYYNQKDKANTQAYMDKIEAIDASNAFLKQLKDLMKTLK